MIFMHETNAEVLEGLSFSQNWVNCFENYKYKCLSFPPSAVRKYESRLPCRIFSVFNKGSYFVFLFSEASKQLSHKVLANIFFYVFFC